MISIITYEEFIFKNKEENIDLKDKNYPTQDIERENTIDDTSDKKEIAIIDNWKVY